MPQVSYDGQSFSIDGRRIWLVSGAIHYTRVPRELWRNRIRAAKQAGLNCIETYVFWNIHEPRPGRFRFQGQNDLKHFVELIHEQGLFCILRPGPYVCAEWDFGGLPPWLLRIDSPKEGPLRLRQADPRFLEACARYLGAVMDQVRDLQVTSPAGGAIVLMQIENEWFCHNPEQARLYLRELVRYLRENGCQTPVIECNNLWQRVDGALSTWNGNQNLAADLRQFQRIQPHAPRLVTEYWTGWFDHWAGQHQAPMTPEENEFRLAQILASGAQYNLYMFHGGTNFGFHAGRSVDSPGCYITTSYDYNAPLSEAGGRGDDYAAVKRISTFASQFGHVLAQLDPNDHCTVVATDGDKEHPLSVVRQTGPQGTVVFLFKSAHDKTKQVDCLLPHGQTLTIPLGDDRVAWFVFDVNLGGVARLSYTTLRPWAFLKRRLLVVFAPADAQGIVCLNDSPLHVQTPRGKTPNVYQHEGLAVAVLNRMQLDAAYITDDDQLVVGADGVDETGQPVAARGWSARTAIAPDGSTSSTRQRVARLPVTPTLEDWRAAGQAHFISGTADDYQPIEGPTTLEQLKCDQGYGWYRIRLPKAVSSQAALTPLASDRLHVFVDGERQTLIGFGLDAHRQPLALHLNRQAVVLADNLGRFCYGWQLGEHKGLADHFYEVNPIKLGKPKIIPAEPPNPTPLGGFFSGIRFTQRGPADSLNWSFQFTGRSPRRPLILEINQLPVQAMILLNDQPVGMYSRDDSPGFARYVLPVPDLFKRGKNTLTLALFHTCHSKDNPTRHLHLYQTTRNLTYDADWAFTPWRPPDQDEFLSFHRTPPADLPLWYRATFRTRSTDAPLWFEPNGLTKGQLFLNEHNIGRYFVASASGKSVGPQKRYYLPEPWLHTDKPNQLHIFEEHGHRPTKCRLVYDRMGPYRK